MSKFQETLQTHIVKLLKVHPMRTNLARIVTVSVEKNLPVVFEAWDNKYQYILRKCRPGDILVIDSYEYIWPGSSAKANKVYKVTNYSSNFVSDIIITNANNSRGKKGPNQIAFCGKSDNEKQVTYFYINKDSNLVNYIVKGRKCRVAGEELKSGSKEKHRRVNVEQLFWI